MLDAIGETAVRTLGVDIANLTTRLAVMTAVLQDLIEQADALDMTQWHSEPVENAPLPAYMAMMPGTEMDKVQALLASINRMK